MKRQIVLISPYRVITLLFSLYLLFSSQNIWAATLTRSFSIEYAPNNLSINSSGVPLHQILEELSSKCGFTVYLGASLKTQNVYLQFENYSLDKGIEKLVDPYNSAIVFEKSLTPDGIEFFSIVEMTVFDKNSKADSYLIMGGDVISDKNNAGIPGEYKQQKTSVNIVSLPDDELIIDPAKSVATKKRVSSSLLKAKVNQKMAELRRLEERMQSDQNQKMRELQVANNLMRDTSGDDQKMVHEDITRLNAELELSKNHNADELKRVKRELDQLKKQMAQQEV